MSAKMGGPCELPHPFDLLGRAFGALVSTACGRPASVPLRKGGFVCLEHAREMADDPEEIDPEWVRRHYYLFEGRGSSSTR